MRSTSGGNFTASCVPVLAQAQGRLTVLATPKDQGLSHTNLAQVQFTRLPDVGLCQLAFGRVPWTSSPGSVDQTALPCDLPSKMQLVK